MPRVSLNAPCPCHSGKKGKGCCAPYLSGTPAPTAETLMRSRFTAYAIGDAGYIIATTHPASPHAEPERATWAEGIREFSAQVKFLGLEVELTETSGDTAVVQFLAKLDRAGVDASFRERSLFQRVGGRWLYREGQPQEPAVSSDEGARAAERSRSIRLTTRPPARRA